MGYTIWLFYIAIEHGSSKDELPGDSMEIFQFATLNHQGVQAMGPNSGAHSDPDVLFSKPSHLLVKSPLFPVKSYFLQIQLQFSLMTSPF